MNPSEPTPKKGLNCRDCGADNPPDARECWLCLRSDWRPDATDRPEPSTAPFGTGSRIAFLLVLIALVVFEPGAIVVLPPVWVITEIRASRLRRRGAPMSEMQRWRMILVLTFLLPFLLFVAVAIALSIMCTTGLIR